MERMSNPMSKCPKPAPFEITHDGVKSQYQCIYESGHDGDCNWRIVEVDKIEESKYGKNEYLHRPNKCN